MEFFGSLWGRQKNWNYLKTFAADRLRCAISFRSFFFAYKLQTMSLNIVNRLHSPWNAMYFSFCSLWFDFFLLVNFSQQQIRLHSAIKISLYFHFISFFVYIVLSANQVVPFAKWHANTFEAKHTSFPFLYLKNAFPPGDKRFNAQAKSCLSRNYWKIFIPFRQP